MRAAQIVLLSAVAAVGLGAPAATAGPADCPPGVASATGSNPSYAVTATLLEEAAVAYDVPPQVLKAIAYREGFNDAGRRWSQYHSTGAVVISAADAACGVGIMQVTAASDPDPVRLAGDIEYNIDRGAAILAAKFAANQAQNPDSIGPDDRYLVENWYYATCAYNGCGTTTTYPDAVARSVADPFRDLPSVRAWAAPLGYTRPQDADGTYVFPGGFQAQQSPDQFVFYDGNGTITKTVAAPVHDWRHPLPVGYPIGALGPDANGVTCPLPLCQWWRLAEGAGSAGRAHWTYTNGNAIGTSVSWQPALPRTGVYRVDAFVPSLGTDSLGHATYHLPGADVPVDQGAAAGTWAALGDRTLSPGQAVVLDDRGDPYDGVTKLVADAIRFRAVTKLAVAVSAPVITYGGSVTVTATLSHAGGTTIGGRPVDLYWRRRGTTAWGLVHRGTTAADGRLRVALKPGKNTEFTARYAGLGRPELPSASGVARTDVRPGVRATLDRASMPAGGTAYLRTSVAPSHAGRTIYLQRYVSGAWRTVASRTLSSSSTATFSIRLTGRGTYYFRVYHPADSDHVLAVTGTLTLRVT